MLSLSSAAQPDAAAAGRYAALVGKLPGTVAFVYDEGHRLVLASGRDLAKRGWAGGEIVGKRPEDLLPPDYAALINQLIAGALGGTSASTEAHWSGMDLLVDVLPVEQPGGSPEVLVLARDITAMKEQGRRLAETEGRWRAAFEHAPVAIAEVSCEGRLLHANPALCALVGRGLGELAATWWADLVHPEDRAGLADGFAALAGGGGPVAGERRLVRPDGSVVWATSRKSVLPCPDGGEPSLLLYVLDVTAERARREAAQEVSERFSALVEHGNDMFIVLDAELKMRYASPGYQKILGVDPAGLLGTPPQTRVHPDDVAQVVANLQSIIGRPGGVVAYDTRTRCADGSWKTVEVTASNHLGNPLVNGIVCNFHDVTERVGTAQRLAHQATHDDLTGLANRALLAERLGGRGGRPGRPCALFVIDLDKFKLVNDNLGRGIGDQVLVATAERLRAATRADDTVARVGSDEFAVLAEDVGDAGTAAEIAERVLQALSAPVTLSRRDVNVTCSIGVALSRGQGREKLLEEADFALYRAKERGRGRWELFERSMRAASRHQLESEDLLRRALDTDGVVVLYQPIVDMADGTVTATEALVRLSGRRGHLVTPDRFIGAAEDSGLIVPLGALVLDRACAQQARWQGQAPWVKQVSVNLSARQLASADLVGQVARALGAHGLAPGSLCLELTESAIIDAGPSTLRSIEELRSLGVSLALDDFGTGWSSLAYLRRFPLDSIKVDRSFVAGLGSDDDDAEVVRAVIGLGHALRLTSIAEGVETEEQASYLRGLGCDFAQGYLYGRPVAAEHVELGRCGQARHRPGAHRGADRSAG
jgi:diguanylate cyclase (GGDEF)-like protein/PAS domain S-box-containing protein